MDRIHVPRLATAVALINTSIYWTIADTIANTLRQHPKSNDVASMGAAPLIVIDHTTQWCTHSLSNNKLNTATTVLDAEQCGLVNQNNNAWLSLGWPIDLSICI